MVARPSGTRAGDAVGTLHVEPVMGTAVTFDVRDGDATAGIAEAVAWLHHVDVTFSVHRADSVISRLGRGELTLDDLDEVDPDVMDVLLACERLNDDSGGAFDAFAVPAPNGTTLDPSGYVKGWALDRAAAILDAHGHIDFSINGGGDVVLRGEPSPGEPWRVGIRHPDDRDQLAMVLAARGPAAIATSATYERGAHIVDPRQGGATTELASVTVVGPDLTMVDAYATTVFVLGVEGLTWLAGHPGYESMVITHDARVISTPGFATWRDAEQAPGASAPDPTGTPRLTASRSRASR